MMESGKMTNSMDMVYFMIILGTVMLDNGKTELNMVSLKTSFKMEANSKENILKAKRSKVKPNMKMDQCIQEHGRMEN